MYAHTTRRVEASPKGSLEVCSGSAWASGAAVAVCRRRLRPDHRHRDVIALVRGEGSRPPRWSDGCPPAGHVLISGRCVHLPSDQPPWSCARSAHGRVD
eukprot:11239810-Heterocapsa_arctica.AAC.1